MKTNIVLVGFMGTGKNAVGEELARCLNMEFADTDDLIERQERWAIVDIFAKFGEAYFREAEKRAVKEASSMNNTVIATGGGVVLDEENIKILKEKGTVVCLSADADTIYKRTKKYKHRPLLNVGDPVEKIKELLDLRAPFYAKADHQVDTTGLSVEQVARKIIEIVQA
ncbi:MAG: shikimate kinase [Candidatus Omnitrophota bacterium]